MTKKLYKPTVPTPPGDTLAELLDVLNMSQKELAERMGRPLKLINEIIKGKASITPETAIQLERALGKEALFWTNLEAAYQSALAYCEAEVGLKDEVGEASNYPYEQMVSNGWISPAPDKTSMVRNLLEFFGVNSLDNVIENKILEPVLYKISDKKKINYYSLAAWLRKGAVDALKIETETFDEQKLKSKIPELRKLILGEKTISLVDQITKHLAEAGVAFVVTKNLTNVPVNGASRWLGTDKPVVQLSIYGAYADKFWFSLFHEIGHLLMHGKKTLNIDTRGQKNTDVKEAEANEYAKNVLIPTSEYIDFIKKNDFGNSAVTAFAKNIEIDPGIIVGRLQIEEKISFSQLNGLRKKYAWAS